MAAGPELKAIFPMAGRPGTTNEVVFADKMEPWPVGVWCEPAGVTFTATTNKGKFLAVVGKDAAPGPRLVRVYNSEGVSDARFFVVDRMRQLEEKEPNSHLAEAMDPGELPVVVNGRLERNDPVDCFRFELKKGEWLEGWVEAYTLMSKLDAVLKLVTTNGVTLTWNHDFATFDPHLWWRAPEDQVVIAQVFGFVYPANSEIRLYGGEEAVYRLHLAHTGPPSWKDAGERSSALPIAARGTIEKVEQEDRYEFAVKKDEWVEARVRAASLGSPLDAWLKLVDGAGKQLAYDDDAEGSRDPRIEWKAPADTNYFLVVGSVLNRGATNYHYALEAREVAPDFSAVWAGSSVVITNGGTNTVKFSVKRSRGHANDLVAEFRGLPEGVTGAAVSIGSKSGEITMTLAASKGAREFQGPIRLMVLDTVSRIEKAAVVELTTRGEDNGVPNGYNALAIESYDSFWLTVRTQAVAVKEVATNVAGKK
jgi:hypothetical protein